MIAKRGTLYYGVVCMKRHYVERHRKHTAAPWQWQCRVRVWNSSSIYYRPASLTTHCAEQEQNPENLDGPIFPHTFGPSSTNQPVLHILCRFCTDASVREDVDVSRSDRRRLFPTVIYYPTCRYCTTLLKMCVLCCCTCRRLDYLWYVYDSWAS